MNEPMAEDGDSHAIAESIRAADMATAATPQGNPGTTTSAAGVESGPPGGTDATAPADCLASARLVRYLAETVGARFRAFTEQVCSAAYGSDRGKRDSAVLAWSDDDWTRFERVSAAAIAELKAQAALSPVRTLALMVGAQGLAWGVQTVPAIIESRRRDRLAVAKQKSTDQEREGQA